MDEKENPRAPAFHHPSYTRRLAQSLAFFLICLLLFRAIGAEPYGVPTGSMVPTLSGNHMAVECPRCGYPFQVGLRENGHGHASEPESGFCPNCGCEDIDLGGVPACRGDHLLVNKNVYEWRRPRRWEMAVFRCPAEGGRVFVKRVIGLPGEAVQIRDGDIYIDHQLARKSLAEARAVRVPVFDQAYQPPQGWQDRWETQPTRGLAPLEGSVLNVDALDRRDEYDWLVYRHWSLDLNKAQVVRDEYSYNGGGPARSAEAVHDFLVEADVEVLAGDGWFALTLTDGLDNVLAELPVGADKGGARLSVGPREVRRASDSPHLTEEASILYRTGPSLRLEPGRRYRVEFAFVDRRAMLAVDGRAPFEPLDLPSVEKRGEVVQAARLGARGANVRVHNFRLFRDIHYTKAGRHAADAPVRLGAGQYFVLGDNSPNSDDSRFWSDAEGKPVPVPETGFVGKPFLVHLPSRSVNWSLLGRAGERQGIDWGRVRWLH